MPKRKRFTPRTRSSPAQSVSHGSPHSEPIAHAGSSINIEVQNSQSTPSDQNSQPTQPEDQNLLPTYRRKSAKYWTVHLIDEEGVSKEDYLRVADVLGLPKGKKVILEWNQEGQPIGESAGLLGGFLGSLAANVNKFPISYEKWPKVPLAYKDHVWNETIKEMCEKNTANRLKQIVPHTLGSKTIARKRHELEIQTGRSYSRGEMYSISHKKKDGTFVNDEAKQKSDLLDDQTNELPPGENAYNKVFGKEHPGRVRGMGFGVCPSQVLGPTCHSRSSSIPSFGDASSSELAKLKQELEASNARVEALEQEVSKVRILEDQIAFLMQNYGGQLPPRFNQVPDLGSPAEARCSSYASHEP